MSSLIGRVAVDPATVRPGESAYIEVFDPDGVSLVEKQVDVSINGLPGAAQFLQFPAEGERRITVVARVLDTETQQEVSELTEAMLDVRGEPLVITSAYGGAGEVAVINASQSADQPYLTTLVIGQSVGQGVAARQEQFLAGSPMPFQPFAPDSPAARRAGTGRLGRLMVGNPQARVHAETRHMPHPGADAGTDGPTAPALSAAISVAEVYDLSNVDVGLLFEDESQAFFWDFGDGTSATTDAPVVTHDYFAAVDHAAGKSTFTVTCEDRQAGFTLKRSLVVYSAYAIAKTTGTVAAHVRPDVYAHKRDNLLTGSFTISNVEYEPMVLDRLAVTPDPDYGEGLGLPSPFISLDVPVTVDPRSAAMIQVSVRFVALTLESFQDSNPEPLTLPFDVKTYTVTYLGQVGASPVRAQASFEVPAAEWQTLPRDLALGRQAVHWDRVATVLRATLAAPGGGPDGVAIDAKTGTMAASLGQLRPGGQPAAARNRALRALSAVHAPSVEMARSRLAAAAAGAPAHQSAVSPAPTRPRRVAYFLGQEGPLPAGPIVEGQVCHPENLTEADLAVADAAQLVCQLTDEVGTVEMPARWMNARKGDCILSPGGDGVIGRLLQNVYPPQWYSHVGIMTRNYDEITHSTGSQERLLDHLRDGGRNGFEPAVLKYVWPGPVTQTVQASVGGEWFPDPEYGKAYLIESFGPRAVGFTHNGRMITVPPLVVKPDPLQETQEVRASLHAVANSAREDAGRPGLPPRYHYRWYCFTDPTIALREAAGPEAGWAAGTLPSVCSSYVWMHAKQYFVRLEGGQEPVLPADLEPEDVAAGAVVRASTPDGLYTYSAAERLNGAKALYNMVWNDTFDRSGYWGELFFDVADDAASQILNAFTRDDADAKDSSEWRNMTDADAISPANLLWWDSPARGGLYGYAEPALYREPRPERYTVSRWKKVVTRGALSGTVYSDAGPIPGAVVSVYESKSTVSDPDGHFALIDVPLGAYEINASCVIDGILYSTRQAITLSGEAMTLDLHLSPPEESYRLATLVIDFAGTDDETWPWSDEHLDPPPQSFQMDLGPHKPIAGRNWNYKWGGEVRVEYELTLSLLADFSIALRLDGYLYEGTSEDNNKLRSVGSVTFRTPAGRKKSGLLSLTWDGGDEGVIKIAMDNNRNNK